MKKPILKYFAAILLIIIGYLTYYQLWYKSEKADSNIFILHKVLAAHTAEVWSVKFSPDGNWLASGSVDSTVKIWNKQDGKLFLNLKHPAGITYVTFSPDGNLLATASYDSKVRLWKLPEGMLIKEFTGNAGTVWCLDFSPDGRQLASGGEDALIHVFDVPNGTRRKTLSGHTLNIWDVKFSPDGKYIASGSFDKTVRIWNADNGRQLNSLTDHSEAIVSLAFSHDAKMLATTSDDKTIKLWNTVTWHLIRTLKQPEHIQACDFSPDDKLLLTGGRDKPALGEFLQNFFGDSRYNKGISMRLWDVGTGKLLQTFSEHSNDVNDVSYCADGEWIASASADKTIELWRLSGK